MDSNNNTEDSSIAEDKDKEKEPMIIKPLEEWVYEDFCTFGCIYCMNNGGYLGPVPLTTHDYEYRSVRLMHKRAYFRG
jgi:sulfatase maturation enzyme AslB (radical SAM superfamily)